MGSHVCRRPSPTQPPASAVPEQDMTIVARDDVLQIDRLELAPFGTNAYIATCKATRDSVVFDAPGEPDKLLGGLEGTNPRYILITHSHADHTLALADLASRLQVPVAAHPLDARAMPRSPDVLPSDGDTVSFGKVQLQVLHTPGHTPGSICYLMGRYLIAGDTLFPGGPGKTSSPAALQQIIESLRKKVFALPDDTQVYPGHGDSTVLRKEKEEFAYFSSRAHDPDLCGDVLWLSS